MCVITLSSRPTVTQTYNPAHVHKCGKTGCAYKWARHKLGAAQVNAAQVGAAEVGTAPVGAAHVGAAHAAQVGAATTRCGLQLVATKLSGKLSQFLSN